MSGQKLSTAKSGLKTGEKPLVSGKSDPRWLVPIFELRPGSGAVKAVDLKLDILEQWGTDVMWIEPGQTVQVELDLQAVKEGIIVNGTVSAPALGECVRCIEPVNTQLEAQIAELVAEAAVRDEFIAQGDEEAVDMPIITGPDLDLEPLVREAIIIEMPFLPVCRPDCEGLCPDCGEPWKNLPADHQHDVYDPRWAKLAAITGITGTEAEK